MWHGWASVIFEGNTFFISLLHFIQVCPSDVSYKCVIQMCHTNVSYKCVVQMCHTNVSTKCVWVHGSRDVCRIWQTQLSMAMYSHEVLDTIGHQSQMSRSLGQVWTLRSLMQLHSPHWLGRHHLKYVQNYFMKQNVNRLVQLVDFYMILYWYTQYELSHSTCKFTKLHHLLSIDGFVFWRSLHTAALNRCTRNSGFGSTLLRKIVKSCIPSTIALFSPKFFFFSILSTAL